MKQAFRYYKNHLNNIYGKLNEIALIQVEFNDDGIAKQSTDVFSKELK